MEVGRSEADFIIGGVAGGEGGARRTTQEDEVDRSRDTVAGSKWVGRGRAWVRPRGNPQTKPLFPKTINRNEKA